MFCKCVICDAVTGLLYWIRNFLHSMEHKQGTTAALRRRSSNSKSPDLVHLGYSMHVAAANGDKRRVKRCLKAGILELLVGIATPDLNFQSRDSGLSNSQSRDPVGIGVV